MPTCMLCTVCAAGCAGHAGIDFNVLFLCSQAPAAPSASRPAMCPSAHPRPPPPASPPTSTPRVGGWLGKTVLLHQSQGGPAARARLQAGAGRPGIKTHSRQQCLLAAPLTWPPCCPALLSHATCLDQASSCIGWVPKGFGSVCKLCVLERWHQQGLCCAGGLGMPQQQLQMRLASSGHPPARARALYLGIFSAL